MTQSIPNSSDLRPGYGLVSVRNLRRQLKHAADRLRYDQHLIADGAPLQFRQFFECLCGYKSLGAIAVLQDVPQALEDALLKFDGSRR